MKTVFSLLYVLFGMVSFAIADNSSNNHEYFICHFNSEITTSEITELKQQGFQIVEKDSSATVVYVTTRTNSAYFSNELKRKMDKLIRVDEYGNRISRSQVCCFKRRR